VNYRDSPPEPTPPAAVALVNLANWFRHAGYAN
jgi:hypothetical protein